jgi:hypothetical protein
MKRIFGWHLAIAGGAMLIVLLGAACGGSGG